MIGSGLSWGWDPSFFFLHLSRVGSGYATVELKTNLFLQITPSKSIFSNTENKILSWLLIDTNWSIMNIYPLLFIKKIFFFNYQYNVLNLLIGGGGMGDFTTSSPPTWESLKESETICAGAWLLHNMV